MSPASRRLGWLAVSVGLALSLASSLGAADRRVGQAERSPTTIAAIADAANTATQGGQSHFCGVLPQKSGQSPKPPAKLAPGGIIISRETTFITAPLRKDGSVDYLAAITERYSRGVTPGNNAVVLFLQAVGPRDISGRIRPRFFEMLGTAPLPEKGPYLEHFIDYCQRRAADAPAGNQQRFDSKKAEEEFDRLLDRPWSQSDSPLGAAWLAENQWKIDLLVAATMRPRFYTPLVTEKDEPGTVISVLLPVVQQSRDAARFLKTRAMFRIGSEKPDDAWRDILACHRLARLVDQGPTLVEGLVAIAIEGMAIQGDAALAHEGKLTAEQASRYAAQYRSLPPLAKMADRIDWSERLMYLDCVLAVSRKGVGEISPFLSDGPRAPKGTFTAFIQQVISDLTDWNEPMRMGNEWYDRLVAALRKRTPKERNDAVAAFERDLKKVVPEVKDPRVLLRESREHGSLRTGMSRIVGRVFIALLMPALSACRNAEDRITGTQSLVPAVFALAAYRTDQGAYPPELAALVPTYLPAVPRDPFGEAPLRYKRDGAGYLIYSVGANGKDDGGRSWWDEPGVNDARQCDDIAIRVPPQKK